MVFIWDFKTPARGQSPRSTRNFRAVREIIGSHLNLTTSLDFNYFLFWKSDVMVEVVKEMKTWKLNNQTRWQNIRKSFDLEAKLSGLNKMATAETEKKATEVLIKSHYDQATRFVLILGHCIRRLEPI
jgi:hypothetical protein